MLLTHFEALELYKAVSKLHVNDTKILSEIEKFFIQVDTCRDKDGSSPTQMENYKIQTKKPYHINHYVLLTIGVNCVIYNHHIGQLIPAFLLSVMK